MNFSSWFRKKCPRSNRPRGYRPMLECLEDRCLLSGGFTQVNLAADVPGLARVLDPNLVNPWGISFSPTGPFWFSENGSGVSDLLDGHGQPLPLVVGVPSGTPTGTVFNGTPGFTISENGTTAPSRFLFATLDGTIAGWTTLVDPTHAVVAVDNSSSGAVYTGLALATELSGQSYLYAADFSHGTIDVFDQEFRPVARPGAFQDPNLPAGFAPFNIQNINNLLFVTYAQQNKDKQGDVPGPGNGFIDVYDVNGRLVERFASQGALDSPWGLALAPASFGPFGGALLVGNNGDGHINAYNARSGAFLGELTNDRGTPLTIGDLWGLTFGNGHVGGDSQTLFFTAGVAHETHGLFGAIQAPGRHGADTAGTGAFDPNAPGEVGDYPLPPSAGPALHPISADQPMPIADLLPLRESSLALVPTLTAVSPSSSKESGSDPTFLAGFSVGASVFPASNSSMAIPAYGNWQQGAGHPYAPAGLNALLNWSPSQQVPQKQGGEQPSGTNLDVAGTPGCPATTRAAWATGLRVEARLEKQEAQGSEELSPRAPAPSEQAEEVLAAVPSADRAETLDERSTDHPSGETPSNPHWTNMISVLFAVSIPAIWAYWVGHQARLGSARRQHTAQPLAPRDR